MTLVADPRPAGPDTARTARAHAAFARFDGWMRGTALPFWAGAGLCPDGGVVERLDLSGAPERPGFKRVRVHARQLYVFSHAHVAGEPGMLAAAEAAKDFLLAHGRAPEGGWVVRMGERGGIVDGACDLYDQAFVILALAWWHRASGDPEAIDLARETLAVIERRFARVDGIGWLSRLPDRGETLQNPHMHLFEALLALQAAAPAPRTGDALERLRALFDAHLMDPATGTLGERYTVDWRPAPGPEGQIVEPGHHYEWVWLLHRAEAAGLGVAEPAASRLFAFAERHGLAPGALIHDAVDRDGRVMEPDHRSWPQTERLKALVVLGERHGFDRAAIADALEALWHHYLAPAPAGGWIDHVTPSGAPRVSAIPASTLYHLFLAHRELARAAPALFGDASIGAVA